MAKLGFQVLNAGRLASAEHVVDMAERLQALGYDSMVVTDHVVVPRRIASSYPYDTSGQFFAAPDADYLEAISMLAFVAGIARTIRFGPSVLVLPYRNPVLTAKMLATIDVLSGGRLFVGVGAGWLAEEFAIMGSPPFGRRATVADEWIEIFLTLWTEDDPSYEGEFYRVHEVGFFPKPVQKPHPPLYVGGHTRSAIRRAARYGQNWHVARVPPAGLPPLLAYLGEQLEQRARAPASCGFSVRYGARVIGPRGDGARREFEEPGQVFVGTAPQVAEELKPLMDLDPTDVILDCRTGSYAEVVETMERLAHEVWPKLSDRAG